MSLLVESVRRESPPLDPSSGEARRWLADELAKAEYSVEESPVRRLVRAVIDWFLGLFQGEAGETVSRWWVLAGLLALALIAAVVIWAILRVQPGRRVRRAGEGGVFEETGVSAEEYRRRAREARSSGDFSAAVLDGFRAVAASAVERFILDDRPGATAREIAVALAAEFPDERDGLSEAARVFGAVRYGDATADGATADAVLALDGRLLEHRPQSAEAR